jgi:2-polyprenyl-6-methoxyphenol hydroxylase-like FAD-dependent oxidoreductase
VLVLRKEFDVLIVGDGPVGPRLASELALVKVKVAMDYQMDVP